MLQYLQWRVNTGLNVRIEVNFMIPGHTKFSPDRNFGIWKFKYARSDDIDSFEDLIEMIEGSPGGFNVVIPTILNGKRNVIWYDWSTYLSTYFRTFPGLTDFHKFVLTMVP